MQQVESHEHTNGRVSYGRLKLQNGKAAIYTDIQNLAGQQELYNV